MKLNNLLVSLEPWLGLDAPVAEVKPTQSVVLTFGTLPVNTAQMPEQAGMEVISCDRELAYVVLAYHKQHEQQVLEELKNKGWTRVDLPDVKGAPSQAKGEIKNRLDEISREREEITNEALALIKYKPELEFLYDYLQIQKDRWAFWENSGETDKTFYVEGWVPETKTEQLKTALNDAAPLSYIVLTDADEDDDVPTVLQNPKIVEPFELITELYSLPGKNDIDPNIFMAPFFFVFFGMMVSDAGYGLILALVSGLAMKKIKPKGLAKKLLGLLFLGGVSTFFWGAVFGGWFGDIIKIKPLWMNPLNDPMKLLIFSFVLGIIQIYTGLFLKGYKKIRDGNAMDALLDQGLWLVFLTGFVMFALPGMGQLAKVVVIAGAAGLVLTQGRHQKSPISKLTSGLLSLYDVTGYLSDVLSYSRVLALGLATGVIATVINTMAKLIGVNIIGYVFMVILLIGGHIFNVAINALGAYVHSSRLQYVEFFSKFYEGGGRAFKPFKVKTSYIELSSKDLSSAEQIKYHSKMPTAVSNN